MTGVSIKAIRDGTENQIGQLRPRSTVVDRREHGPLRPVPVADHRPVTQPTLESRQRQVAAVKRLQLPTWWLPSTVRGNAACALVERQVRGLLLQVRNDIGHGRQDSESRSPIIAV